ncbi:MAG TPA: DUF58 domain-containing protein [Gemmatimonadales bacterium]|nr:DUF58 domain-containing protein [Gemmatimonadales bacterium]
MIELDARTLASLGDLELVARRVVDGFMFGTHPSRLQGAGVEFSQYRSYQPGDDIRRIDWKLFARSDRYFLRESEVETSVTVRLILDASDSMRQEEDGVSKFTFARLLAASLATLAFRQGDAVGLTALLAGGARAWPASRGRLNLNRTLRELERLSPAGAWPGWRDAEGALLSGSGRSITFVLTDLHERSTEIRAALRKLSALGHDVAVLHLIGRRELEFDYGDDLVFEELETGRTLDVSGSAVRAHYLASLDGALRAVELELGEQRIEYTRIRLDTPLDAALRQALVRRLRR